MTTLTGTNRTLWAGCVVFVPLVVIATVAVEALPRVRGIAFAPQLRRFEKAFPNHKTIELANTNHFFYGGRRPAEG